MPVECTAVCVQDPAQRGRAPGTGRHAHTSCNSRGANDLALGCVRDVLGPGHPCTHLCIAQQRVLPVLRKELAVDGVVADLWHIEGADDCSYLVLLCPALQRLKVPLQQLSRDAIVIDQLCTRFRRFLCLEPMFNKIRLIAAGTTCNQADNMLSMG
jgi:hypothetical protein